jgi:hypothetical protein
VSPVLRVGSDRQGLPWVVETLDRYADKYGERLRPAALLRTASRAPRREWQADALGGAMTNAMRPERSRELHIVIRLYPRQRFLLLPFHMAN